MWTTSSLTITKHEALLLHKLDRAPSTPQGIVLRVRIVRLAGDGAANSAIAKRLHVSRPTVLQWRNRFAEKGIEGLLHIAQGRGRKPQIEEKKVEAIIYDTLHTAPKDSTHWSTRTLAAKHHVSHDFVKKVWQTHGLKPWLVRSFKVSSDPHFIEKLKDVVGLYICPPEHALVFSLDEKTQIQALDRTQPSLRLTYGYAKTATHDYKRNGTTSLFAALNVLKGNVIGMCRKRHRHQEFLAFLQKINQAVPQNLDIHCIVDNYSTHNHPAVKAWLTTHSKFHFHFIPTSSSWLNLIERWFGEITRKRIRRGSFSSEQELIQTIHSYITENNKHPQPFIWTKSADEIIAKVNKCKSILHTVH